MDDRGAWQARLKAELKRDWRRTGLLVVLTVVGVALLVRQFAGGPQPAQATRDGAQAGQRPKAGAKPSQPNAANVADEPGEEKAAIVGQAARVIDFATDPGGQQLSVPRRDPFRADLSRFPADPTAAAPKAKPEDAVEAVNSEGRQTVARQAALLAEAGKLKIQSILMAEPPRAMIGNDVYGVGDKVGSFAVTAIKRTSITLEADGFEVVVKLE